MNKTSIEWCDYTWNPVTGCRHGCSYCYARKIAERFKGTKAWPNGFEPMQRPERLSDPEKMKKPRTIFVCSMADLFGDWVPESWISKVFEYCGYAPWHTYIFLTKNPIKIPKFSFKQDDDGYVSKTLIEYPRNWWFGASCSSDDDQWRIDDLKTVPSRNLFVSFEPLLLESHSYNLRGIKQVIIGAQTNPSVEVTPEMVRPIGQAAFVAGNIALFCKDSMPSWACRRELMWPIHKEVGP